MVRSGVAVARMLTSAAVKNLQNGYSIAFMSKSCLQMTKKYLTIAFQALNVCLDFCYLPSGNAPPLPTKFHPSNYLVPLSGSKQLNRAATLSDWRRAHVTYRSVFVGVYTKECRGLTCVLTSMLHRNGRLLEMHSYLTVVFAIL